MQLYYYNSTNFGDALNAWLWPQLIGDLLDDDPERILVGIGTVLDPDVPSAPHKYVLSSGTGYRQPPDVLGARWTVLAVRGPLTARVLGLPPETAVTDGALLLRQCVRPRSGATEGPAFMPHCSSVAYYDWARFCETVGYRYIDPRAPVEVTIEAIRASSVVVCEAMHGAIVADALRVPWIPVKAYRQVNTFKWSDWFLSLTLGACLQSLPPLFRDFRVERGYTARWADGRGLMGKIRRLPTHALWAARRLTRRRREQRSHRDVERLFGAFAQGEGAMLSSDVIIENRLSRLLECVGRLRELVAARS